MKNSVRRQLYIVVGLLSGVAFSMLVCGACTAVEFNTNSYRRPPGPEPDTRLVTLLLFLAELFGPVIGAGLGIVLSRLQDREEPPPDDEDDEPPTPPIPDEPNPNRHHLRGQSPPFFKGK